MSISLFLKGKTCHGNRIFCIGNCSANSPSLLLPVCFLVLTSKRIASMLTMQGKNVAIFGMANKRSIAWAIAQRLSDAGAKLAITYQNARLKAEAHDLVTSLPGAEPFQCDVSSDAEIG